MMEDKPPCYDCTGRYIGCHSGCPTWRFWKSKHDAMLAAVRRQKKAEEEYLSTQIEKKKRFRRHRK